MKMHGCWQTANSVKIKQTHAFESFKLFARICTSIRALRCVYVHVCSSRLFVVYIFVADKFVYVISYIFHTTGGSG